MSNSVLPAIDLRRVAKVYPRDGAPPFRALTDVDLRVAAGEMVAVLGKSGSGKSTLLNFVAGLDRPTTGEAHVAGAALHAMSEDALGRWRGRAVGVVFQFFQLLPTLTVRENVLIAMDFVDVVPRPARAARAAELLALVDLADQADKLPATLSGGQQQRAAVARALANDPPVLVADEPTGNLDSRTAASVLAVFGALVARGTTLVVVTHDEDLAHQAHRVVRLADGVVVEDRTLTAVTGVA